MEWDGCDFGRINRTDEYISSVLRLSVCMCVCVLLLTERMRGTTLTHSGVSFPRDLIIGTRNREDTSREMISLVIGRGDKHSPSSGKCSKVWV